MILRCTGRARDRLGLTADDLANGPGDEADLAEWYCNVVVLERRPVFLLTHARTLFATWMFMAGKTDPDIFWREARAHIHSALTEAGVASDAVGRVLGNAPDRFAETVDRGVLGSMVEYAKMAKVIVPHRGGLGRMGLDGLTAHVNEAPMSRIDMNAPEDEMRSLLG